MSLSSRGIFAMLSTQLSLHVVLIMSVSADDAELVQMHVSGRHIDSLAADPICKNVGESFEYSSKGMLFPYASKGKGSSCDTTDYCIGECNSAVYNADFTYGEDKLCTKASAEKGCNLGGSLSALFIDFDGTLELYDDLADDVNELLPALVGLKPEQYKQRKLDDPRGANTTNQVTGATMIAALKEVFNKSGGTQAFLDNYFLLGEKMKTDFDVVYETNRVAMLKKALDFFRDNGVKTYVMSASWAPISAEAWKDYLTHLTTDDQYGLNLSHHFDGILTVDDPGGDTPGNKAVKMAEVMTRSGKTLANAVHIDNSYKYMQQIVKGERMQSIDGAANGGGVSPSMNKTGSRSEKTRTVFKAGVQCSHFRLIAEEYNLEGFVGAVANC